MRKLFILLILSLLTLPTLAQKFTEQVQVQPQEGVAGSLVIHQSAALANLVNGVVVRTTAGTPGMRKPTEPGVEPTNMAATTGYRIQVVSADKATALAMRNKVRATFSNFPVYVSFQSPHWLCRVGDFETKAEAAEYLSQFRRAGFPESIIVRTKVVVRY